MRCAATTASTRTTRGGTCCSEQAFHADPSARGDTRAQSDLLGMADEPEEVWVTARTLLSNTYGGELAELAEQAARRAKPVARARLLALAAEGSAMQAQRKGQ